MSFQITDAFVQQFSGNVRLLAQQMTSRFRGRLIEDNVRGEAAYMDQLGPTSAIKLTARHMDTPMANTPSARRRLAPYAYVWADLVDRQDQVELLIDPASGYARNAAMAMQRAYDDEAISAFFANAYTGHTGTTTVVWPNGNNEGGNSFAAGYQVAVDSWMFGAGAGNAGLTTSKFIEAAYAILAGEGDENEEKYAALRAKDIMSMMATTEVTSSEYADLKALQEGKIDRFMGFQIVHTERLFTNGSGYYRLPFWRKSGMGIGVAREMDGRISERNDKNHATQVYCDEVLGASRLEEVKIVEVIVLP